MKTIFLHIGTHKTGTTSLQQFFARTASRLAREGVLYPRTGRTERLPWAHHGLAWSFLGWRGRRGRQQGDALRREIEAWEGDRVLISCEDFSLLSCDKMRRLGRWLAGHRIEVVCYLRPPKDYVLSLYRQHLLSRGHRAAARFVLQASRRADYLRLVQRWERLDGLAAMHLRPFDRVKRAPGLEADAAAWLGIDITRLANHIGPAVNVSPPPEVLRAVRAVTRLEKRLVHGFGMPARLVGSMARRMRRTFYRTPPGGMRRRSLSLLVGREPFRNDVPTEAWDAFRERLAARHQTFLDRYIDPDDHPYLQL
ncbi:MAG: hypothetical protein D6746_06955 [Bacteroidetes bacterium]|nr:MAG: hypothetical protein D6746_06955 [Bacteroidota bacterium]